MAMTGLERLQLVQVKIGRAKQNIVDLEELLDPFRDFQDAFFRTKFNPDVGQWEQNIPKEVVPILDVTALAIAGDVIHNLRTALDHLAYQLIVSATGKEFPENTGFPIADSLKGYEIEKKRRQVERMMPAAIQAIDSLQPYRDGMGHDLWRIHKLDTIDKHRLLVTVAVMTLCYSDNFGQALLLETSNPDFVGIFQGKVDKEATLAAVKVVQSNPLLPTLHQYIRLVDGIVLKFLTFL